MQTRNSLVRAAVLTALFAPIAVLPSQVSAACVGADVTAKVVALDQVIVYNRLGAFAPAGMMFALAQDVFPKGTLPANETLANSCASVACSAGDVQLRSSKRPRPLTLRANEQNNICIEMTNLVSPAPITNAGNVTAGVQVPPLLSEQPGTRHVGLHIQGMQWVNGPQDDGSFVGANASSLAAPNETRFYTYYAEKDGAYVITSGPNVGGEGDSGAIASGLFGIMNVEPPQSEWYRSQVSHEDMVLAADANGNGVLDPSEQTPEGQPILNYGATYPAGHPYAGQPILRITQNGEIVHNDLNAVITGPGLGGVIGDTSPFEVYPDRGNAFREFSVVFHDEVKVVQAFPGWFTPLKFTLGGVKDGFAINYGTGGIGSEIIANRLGVGPMKDCVECKYEEFFLTSWAVGDPAMVVDVPANQGLEACDPGLNNCAAVGGKATKAFFPEDPSNVWHGYMNERTKIRNVHVGTEHHIFHLHAHQWLFAPKDNGSNYLDAQAIGPGSSFTYEIAYGGAGNRNKTVGDSIFHCHFYPHFAQGMWGLWRVHDVFEAGSVMNPDGTVASRGLVDGEIAGGGYMADGTPIAGGTPIPGIVPVPALAMAPMPGSFVADTDGDGTAETPHMGYPFFVEGVAGHRPPSPPLDIVQSGGIPRHIITGGTAHAVQTATDFDKVLLAVTGFEVPEDGTAIEKAAMAFHGPQSGADARMHPSYAPNGTPADFEVNGMAPVAGAPFAEPCRPYDGVAIGNYRKYKASVIELDADLNKVGWHFGQERIIVLDDDVAPTLAGTRAPEPFVMRANTRDCVDFDHTNLVPNIYQLDDFQVRTPTDIIGQHIHLVKFDVMSADGAANGWNYEDGTLSPDEIAERIHALEAGSWTGSPLGVPGPRTTRQRWYVDTGWRGNVFTHDHFGPSTHQQAGLYATLLVEPEGSTWRDPTTGETMGTRVSDGGPTSWRADIITADDAYREFYLEFADYQLAYRSAQGDGAGVLNGPNWPVNPSDRNEVPLPNVELPNLVTCAAGACRPEAISSRDPGTYVVNYRNEPLAMRVRDPATNKQAAGKAGDLGFAFSSLVNRADARLNTPPSAWPYGIQTATEGALTGDPFTPLLRVYEGDKVHLRVQVGAHEEGHNFSMNGVRWLQQWASGYSGFRNSQMAGISEYFIFELPSTGSVKGASANGFEDYMYQTGSSVDARWNGTWGLMRAYAGTNGDLLPLPNNPNGKAPPADGRLFSGACPKATAGAAARKYSIVAAQAKDILPDGAIIYNSNVGTLGAGMEGPLNDPTGLVYVLASDLDKRTGKLKANRRVEPLILRANAGECINITLTNNLPATLHGPDPAFPADTQDLAGYNIWPMIVNEFNANNIRPSSEVGLHAQLVEYDMFDSDGMNVGQNPKMNGTTILTTAGPGETVKYQWYAGQVVTDVATGTRTAIPTEFGAINLMAADPLKGSNKGLIGALVIEPAGSIWPVDGEPGTDGLLTRASVTVIKPDLSTFRDAVAIYQDDVNFRFADGSPVPAAIAEFEPENSGHKGLNYRSEPLWFRMGIDPNNVGEGNPATRVADFTNVFSNAIWEPVTPIFTATRGQETRFRVVKPGGHTRNNVWTLHGHLWARHPYNADSTVIDPDNQSTFWHGEQMGHGPANHFDAIPLHGAGGVNHLAGDYLYRDMQPVHQFSGEWGVFRVQ